MTIAPTSTEPAASPGDAAIVDRVITRRTSIRAYLPDPVPRQDIEAILRVAGRAPSGTNIQPWKVYVLTGERLAGLSQLLLALHADPAAAAQHKPSYAYYPAEWRSPYVERRRKVGLDLYRLLGIAKGEQARMHEQHGRNYAFFDAPVGLLFTIDHQLEIGSWLDYGMFLQSIMIAAQGRGLGTCPQAAFARFHRVILPFIGAAGDEQLVCGMSLGHADPAAIENGLVTDREPLASFVRFVP